MSMLADVNSRLKPINIKGKPYIDVPQRIQGFWELYPMGSIETELLNDNGERCTFKAVVKDDDGTVLATGHAFEVKKGMVNSTSYIENCETSAVGRALGMLGIGSTDSIASAEEVKNAIEQQEAAKPKDRFDRVRELKKEALSIGIKEEGIKAHMNATYKKPMKDFMPEEVHAFEKYLEGIIRDQRELNGLAGA